MTDAPERIWVWPDYDGDVDGVWLDAGQQITSPSIIARSYIREDVATRQIEGALNEALEKYDRLLLRVVQHIRTVEPFLDGLRDLKGETDS